MKTFSDTTKWIETSKHYPEIAVYDEGGYVGLNEIEAAKMVQEAVNLKLQEVAINTKNELEVLMLSGGYESIEHLTQQIGETILNHLITNDE